MKVTAHFFTTTACARTAKSALTLIAVAALLAAGPKAYGGTLFVDVNDADCADAGDNLYCEIQDAVDDALEGDNVLVRDGTYDPIVIDTDNLTIQAVGRGAAIIDATGVQDGVTLNADGVTLRRLTVENADDFGFLVTGNANDVGGSTARDNGAWGFLLEGNFNVLTGNTAHGNVNGLQIEGDTNTLNANTAFGNNNGFVVGGAATNNTLRGNLADNNAFRGFVSFGADSNTVKANTASSNAGFGYFVDDVSLNTFENNNCKFNVLGGANALGICD